MRCILKNNSLITLVLPVLLTPLASAQNVGAHTWSAIMVPSQEVEYALYSQSGVTEYFSSAAPWKGSNTNVTTDSRPPVTYNFSDISFGGTSNINRTVCPAASGNLNNQNWANWDGLTYPHWPIVEYITSEFPLTGGFSYAPTTEFNESEVLSGVYGLEVEGSFNGHSSGSSGGANALEFAYITDNPCSAGDNEYGFYYDVAQAGAGFGTLTFYYSDKTNCGGAAPFCYSNTLFPTKEFQDTGGITSITGLTAGTSYIYHAYLVPDTPVAGVSEDYKFRVEVMDTSAVLVQCSINGGATGNCTTDVPINPTIVWDKFADRLYGEPDVNALVGVEAVGNPTNITSTPGMTITYVKVGS